MSKITCGNCHNTHDSVDEVKACYNTPVTQEVATDFTPPSEKQLAFIKTLMAEREINETIEKFAVRDGLSKRQASWLIETLLSRPKLTVGTPNRVSTSEGTREYPGKVARTLGAALGTTAPAVGEGLYRMDGVIYKVQRALASGNGHLYAKVLKQGHFSYAPGALRKLRDEHKMSLAEAQEFGKLYGQCCVCGRTLTDERSIADGIGPVCGRKSWWRESMVEAFAQEAIHEAHDGSGDGE
jgi:hypothetical protein